MNLLNSGYPSLLKRAATAMLLIKLLATPSLFASAEGSKLIIWADAPAPEWDVAYPVGNGRLGAMPFGEFPKEKILINEETVWARGDAIPQPEDSAEHLEIIRKLEAAGDYAGADRHLEEHLLDRQRPYSYQYVGWLNIDYRDAPDVTETYRELDLKTGITKNIYTLKDGSTITQETYASAPDDVIITEITSSQPITFSLAMEGAQVDANTLVLEDAADGPNATSFACLSRVHSSAKVEAGSNSLTVHDSRHSTIAMAVATNLDHERVGQLLEGDWQAKATNDLKAINNKTAKALRKRAIQDHQQYFERVAVDFGATSPSILQQTTKSRLQRFKDGAHDDPDLIETYFQFGRYLLIASSRPGTFPANLQGIWNPHEKAPWNSDFHLNINIQMNYWLAETTNLSELHQPFFKLIRFFQPNGRKLARRFGMEGFAMGHATDIWGQARLMSHRAIWSGSFLCGQWLTTHILEHYRFSRDPAFLEENWDLLTASTEFAASWLIPGPEEGMLMARPATSPENRFAYIDAEGNKQEAGLSAGNSFDQWMILQTFNDYIEAAKATGKMDHPLVKQVQGIIPKVYRPQIGADGRLMEWRLPFEEPRPDHRHISHVIGAYPGNQINLDEDPAMRSAVMKSIEARLEAGGAGTGWSRAWTIGVFARLSDGARAYENLHAILTKSTLDNLWDTHPPYQIDGNFGATAAIAEMLLHSHNNELRFLPALPDQWPEGHANGLRGRGGYTVDITWSQGQLQEARIHASQNGTCTIAVDKPVLVQHKGKTIATSKPGEKQLSFKAKQGQSYKVLAKD